MSIENQRAKLFVKVSNDFGETNLADFDQVKDDGEWAEIAILDITDKIGSFGPAIQQMTVLITAAASEGNRLWLKYDYQYKHKNGGSNGYTVELRSGTENWK